MRKRKSGSQPESVQLSTHNVVDSNNRRRFAAVLSGHLRKLNWRQSDLAEKTAISASQVCGWLVAERETTQLRTVLRGKVCRVAKALAEGYEDRKDYSLGVEQLDAILNELLEAAGFSAIPGTAENLLWESIAEKFAERRCGLRPKIRVGWVHWAQFCDAEFRGPARDIVEEVVRLLGLSVEPVRIGRLSEMGSMLASRQIDMLAPVLYQPSRMFNVAVSSELPTIKSGCNFLVHKDHCRKLISNSGRPEDIDPSQVRISYVKGGTSEFLRPRLKGPEIWPPEEFETLQDAVESVLSSPVDLQTGAVRIFAADEFICRYEQQSKWPSGAMRLLEKPAIKLSLVLGVNRHEPFLMNAINSCILLLDQNNFFTELRKQYSHVFVDAN